MKINCPKCSWSPDKSEHWNCNSCQAEINYFEKNGDCPSCGWKQELIYCPDWAGGCGEVSNILDWFPDIDSKLNDLNIYKE